MWIIYENRGEYISQALFEEITLETNKTALGKENTHGVSHLLDQNDQTRGEVNCILRVFIKNLKNYREFKSERKV